MTTAYATSADGLTWDWHGTVLAPRPGSWDARGARLTTVLPDGRGAYDGRATKEENWFERIGLARLTGTGPASSSRRTTTRPSMRATSTSCRCRTAATGSTTRPGYPTRVTSSAPSSYHRTEVVALAHAQLPRAPPPLHAVHRIVRLAKECAGFAVRTADRDAEARGHLQRVRDPLRNGSCVLLVCLDEESSEVRVVEAAAGGS